MHFLFLTRCFTTTNLQVIKEDLENVFKSNNKKHTYELVLLVDLSHGQQEEEFNTFKDDHTSVQIIRNKQDKYMYRDANDYLASIDKDENNTYVYFLDDDNTIKPELLEVFDTSDNADMIIFKLEGKNWGKKGCVAGTVDIGNYITKLKTIREVKIGHSNSHCADGYFVESVRKSKHSIIYIDKELGYYNKLSKP